MKSKNIRWISRTTASLAVAPLLTAALVGPSPAHALLLGTQDTPPLFFSGMGTGTKILSPPLTFPTFTPSAIPPSHLNPTLVGYRFYFSEISFTGSVILGNSNPINPISGPFKTQVTIGFQNIDTQTVPPKSPDVAFSPLESNSITGTLAPFTFTTFPISGSSSNVFTSTTALTPPVTTFTNPPTATPVSTAYFTTSWALLGPPDPNLLAGFVNAGVSGKVGVQYVYQYVPGPLPILGSAAAFGWSRRLRRRITQTL